MLRKALLLLTLTAGLVLVVFAGIRNHRDRVRAAEAARANRVDLVKDNAPIVSPNVDESMRGKPAPNFSLVDLSGKKVTLADFKGHPLVLNFWGTYCDPCKIEMPWLEALSKKYAPQGFDVIGVTYDAEVGKAKISKATQELGVTYPILLSDSKIEDAYLNNVEVLPVSFWVDRNGKVVNVTAGLSDDDTKAKNALEAQVQQTIAAD
ncbi:MAG TPA: TlpA disulfide reductase family protein [Acidobacteriaceae bacterium]|nr:TlpA disulfide reductase family protein [Acidobacteriaceae bacterium]